MQCKVIPYFFTDMFKFRIGGPDKVMHIRCIKMPVQFFSGWTAHFASFSLIPVSDFLWILEIPGSPQYVRFVNMDTDIKIAPYTIKFSVKIRCRMPAFEIILT